MTGRKRHILVDTGGLLLEVRVHPGNIQDRDGAKELLLQAKPQLPRLEWLWADGGYAGELVEWAKQECEWTLEIVRRSEGAVGFEVLPRRWVVERTFGWLGRYRRLSKDYEFHTRSSESMVHLAMTHVMVRRLAAH